MVVGFIKKHNTTKNKILLCVFFFSLFIFSITPITCDDWGNYNVGIKGIYPSIKSALYMYKTWEGRFISRILIYILTSNKWLWNILNASLLTLLVSTIYKYLKNNKTILLIPLLGLILVNVPFSSQIYFWLAANITYFFPSVISLAIYTYIYKNKENHYNICITLLLTIISIMIPMFVENIGCAYVFGLFIILIYNYKYNNKISKTILLMLITSFIGLIIMLLSPGSQLRMEANIEFSNMNIIEKIIRNIPNLIQYTFTRNIFILILMLIPVNKYLLSYLNNKKYKKIIIFLFNIIPIITIIQNSIYMLPIGITSNYNGILLTSNWYYIFYWIIFELIYILSIFKYIKSKKDKEYIFILLLIGLSSMGVMLLTPVWGERVSTLYIFIVILSSTRIISEFNINIKLSRLLYLGLIFLTFINTSYSIANKIFDIRRTNTINEQIQNKEESIYIYYSGLTTLWNYTPFEEYHIKTFKKYYNIDEETKLKVKFLSKKQYIKYLLTGKVK